MVFEVSRRHHAHPPLLWQPVYCDRYKVIISILEDGAEGLSCWLYVSTEFCSFFQVYLYQQMNYKKTPLVLVFLLVYSSLARGWIAVLLPCVALFCVTLCCVILCYVALRYFVILLRYVALYCMLRCVILLRYVILCYVALRYFVALRYIVLCCVASLYCYVMLRCVILCCVALFCCVALYCVVLCVLHCVILRCGLVLRYVALW